MVFFNYALRKLNAKIVYYGPGLCGKTTNLQWTHDNFEGGQRGKMISLATEGDRTIFFDLLPLDIGSIRGMQVTLQLYTVPGQVHYNSTRQLVLKGADGVVFVADSQRAMLKSNVESLRNLEENLQLQGIELKNFPFCLQFNKRDLSDLLTIEELDASLNEGYHVPFFEAVATKGIGVQETLEGIVKLVMRNLRERYEPTKGKSRVGIGRPSAPKAPSAPSPPAAPSPPPMPESPMPESPATIAAPGPLVPPQAPPPMPAAPQAPPRAAAPPTLEVPAPAPPPIATPPPAPALETAPPGPVADLFAPAASAPPPLSQADLAPPIMDSEPATDEFEISGLGIDAEQGAEAALGFDDAFGFGESDNGGPTTAGEEDLAASTATSATSPDDIPEISFDDDISIDEPELILDEISTDDFDEDAIEVIEFSEDDRVPVDALSSIPLVSAADDFEAIEVDDVDVVDDGFDLVGDISESRAESSYGIPGPSAQAREEEISVELDDDFGSVIAEPELVEAGDFMELDDEGPINLGSPVAEPTPGDDMDLLEITGFGEGGLGGLGGPAEPQPAMMAEAASDFDLMDEVPAPGPAQFAAGGETFDDLALEVEEEVQEELTLENQISEDDIATDRSFEPAPSEAGEAEPFALDEEEPFADPFATTDRSESEAKAEVAAEVEVEPMQQVQRPVIEQPELAAIKPEVVPATSSVVIPQVSAMKVSPDDNQLQLRLEGTGAIAESGQVRALDITVPVPGTWVGNRRVTLQLRLTLEPTEDRDG